MRRKLKILHAVEQYLPSIGGMQEVVRQISERMALKGHDVTIATSFNEKRDKKEFANVKIVDFKISGKIVDGIFGETNNYIDFLKKNEFDVIVNFAAEQWSTDVILPILNQIKAKKVFVPTGFNSLNDKRYFNYYEMMKRYIFGYDVVVFLSNNFRDINFAKEIGIKNYQIIPNGADEKEFENDLIVDIRKKLNILDTQFLILHVGSHTGIKGHEELIKIFKKSKLRDAVLLIIGNDFGDGCFNACKKHQIAFNRSLFRKIDGKKILIETLNREETVSAYKNSDVFLFPSNVECSPIVLFESMAAKLPFLVTDVGNSVEIVEWTNAGLILPTKKCGTNYSKARVKQSAKMLENIYLNDLLREELGNNGYKSWCERYSWSKIADKYEEMYLKIVNYDSN